MPKDLIGQTCALLTAILWGYAVVLFKRTGETIPPLGLNLFKNAVGLLLLVATLAGLIATGHDQLDLWHVLHYDEICLLLLSGVVGIALADTIFFHALNMIGVGLISVVDCAYSPAVIVCAWLFLQESLALPHYIGAGLILVGVLIAFRHKVPANRTRAQITAGMLLALLAVVMMAIGIVLAKPVLEECSLIWSATIRMTGGTVVLALLALLGRGWRRYWTVFRPAPVWRVALPASVLGTYVCMVLWVAGFKYTSAAIAGLLNQTSVVFASVLAALILKEEFGPRKVAALVLAVIGVLVVTLPDWLAAFRA